MQQKDILETFKKYVGEFGLEQKIQVPICKSQRIQNFGENIKSANELAGALQILKNTCKKILESANTLGNDEIQDQLIIYQIQEQIAQCKFMGNELFDSTLSAKVGQSSIELENPSPMPLLDRGDFSGFVGYMQEKMTEITQSLSALSEAIAGESLFGRESAKGSTRSAQSFETFDASAFLNALSKH